MNKRMYVHREMQDNDAVEIIKNRNRRNRRIRDRELLRKRR